MLTLISHHPLSHCYCVSPTFPEISSNKVQCASYGPLTFAPDSPAHKYLCAHAQRLQSLPCSCSDEEKVAYPGNGAQYIFISPVISSWNWLTLWGCLSTIAPCTVGDAVNQRQQILPVFALQHTYTWRSPIRGLFSAHTTCSRPLTSDQHLMHRELLSPTSCSVMLSDCAPLLAVATHTSLTHAHCPRNAQLRRACGMCRYLYQPIALCGSFHSPLPLQVGPSSARVHTQLM
jgi:hypothetical protein